MKYAIIIALLAAVALQSCVSFNRRYEYMLVDSTAWKYDYRSAWSEPDFYYFKSDYRPRNYYRYQTESFTLNISRVTHDANIYSAGPLLPVIPLFINTNEQNDKHSGIKRLECEIKYKDSVNIENCYLEINNKYTYRPAFGKFDGNWIDGEFHERFDTNRVDYYRKDSINHVKFEIRFAIDQPDIESAVVHFDSVYVDGKTVSLPPLVLRKEYDYYIDHLHQYYLK